MLKNPSMGRHINNFTPFSAVYAPSSLWPCGNYYLIIYILCV